MEWADAVQQVIIACNRQGVRMLMVGGGAVNWHGYKRHSADVDFWIELTNENLLRLASALSSAGYEITDFPQAVREGMQNISIKLSPVDLDLEFITRFSLDQDFQSAYERSIMVQGPGAPDHTWRVLQYEDLITSKIKAGRPKDLLDIQELARLKGKGA